MEHEIKQIEIKAVKVGQRRRKIDDDAVSRLYESAAQIGIQTPITVRPPDDEGRYELVTGATRLAVAALLKQETITARVWDCTEAEAELWEISENLHRTELTASQRDEHVSRYVELATEHDADKRRDIEKAAKKLGMRRTEVAKAAARAELRKKSDFASKAKELGLINSKAALDFAAQAPSTKRAIERLEEFAKRKNDVSVIAKQADKDKLAEEWRLNIRELWDAGTKSNREWFLRAVAGVPATVELEV